MPVPSLVTDLSATIASNSPAGSDNVFPDLDGYLRSLSGFLASIRDNSGNGWVSPYLPLAGGTVTGPATFSSTLALNGALSGTGLTTYLASPPAIGGTAAAAVSSTNLSYTGTLTGGTGVVALGTNQFYKDASGNVGIGTATPGSKLDVVGTAAISGAVTLSGGTANGVAYLNGSKVLTTGSALTFDGGTLGLNVGGGAAINNVTSNLFLQAPVSGGAGFIFRDTSAGSFAEYMRLTSTGLGIGTSSPGTRLHVYSTSARQITSSNASSTWTFGASGPTFAFKENSAGAEQLVLDASGNLGLGVTPSAWAAGYKTLQIGTTGSVYCAGGVTALNENSFFNGTNSIYLTSQFATRYVQTTGQHIWFTAPSGTAGNAISFTQAMTLDASGNLGLGVTPSGSYKLQVNGGGLLTGLNVSTGGANNTANTATFDTDGAGAARFYSRGANTSAVGSFQWRLQSSNGSVDTQAMTLDASGNLQLSGGSTNTTYTSNGQFAIKRSNSSPFMSFHGNDGTRIGYVQMQQTGDCSILVEQNQALTFGTNNTERARISSTGSFTATATVGIATGTHTFSDTSASPGPVRSYHTTDSNGTGNEFLYCDAAASVLRASIRSNGGIANYSANNVSLSDVRTKTDIQPATSYLDKICAIPVKTFLYKDQTDTERNLGVIAQDVDAVAPELIDHSGFGEAPEGESPYLAVYQTDLQYALMKCIQEQQALITALTARVASLETQP